MLITREGNPGVTHTTTRTDFWLQVYIRKKASGAEMLMASRVAVCVVGVVLGGFSCLLQAVGVSINFIYLVVGIITAPGFPPVLMMLLWPRVGKWAATVGALGDQVLAIITWLLHTKVRATKAGESNRGR